MLSNTFKLMTVLVLTSLLLSPPARAQGDESGSGLGSILHREWEALMQRDPLMAIYLGGHSDRLWSDSSLRSRTETAQRYREVVKELDGLDETQLTQSQKLNRELFAQQLGWQIRRFELGLDLFTMNQRDGLHTAATLVDSMTFTKLSDYEKWTKRLEAFGELTDREIATLKIAVSRNRVHPKIITERLIGRVKVQPDLCARPRDSGFFKPFRDASPKLKANPKFRALEERAASAIKNVLGPAFLRLAQYLEGPYLEASPKRVGLGRLEGGGEAYQFLVKRYTTTDLTPAQIHSLGLREVARIRKAMETIKTQVGFEGTLEEFFDHLRTAPEHYVKDPQELLRRYRAFCKTVDGKMPKLFATLPRKPYGVEPIPDYIAPATTTAYYLPGAAHNAGTYFVNLYKPETRALFEIPALSMHEAVPGHHHQIALAGELNELPSFRRYSDGFGDYTVFVEGWALYAESLGEEIGVYQDPYDLFGRYTFEMWRAIRLVVDTGMHSQGWSRKQAIDYFLANSPRSELDVTNEVDRYIGWPGQALAYKMGELKITELRRRAERELGSRFNLPLFHDAVLLQGAVPLDQLERQVDAYIKKAAGS